MRKYITHNYNQTQSQFNETIECKEQDILYMSMAKLHPNVITISAFLLLTTILLLPTCQADGFKSNGPDATMVSKDVTDASPVCVCGPLCGYPCLYSSPPPPATLTPPAEMSPPEETSPPPPFGPLPTPLPPYPDPLYLPPPPPLGEVYGVNGGFVFYKPSLAWQRAVSRAQVFVCGVILILLL